jgi:hypothetical protein
MKIWVMEKKKKISTEVSYNEEEGREASYPVLEIW